MNKIIKQILICIIIIIIILGIILVSKLIIFKNLSKKLGKYTSANNYYIRMYYYEGWYASKTEYWFKDNKLIFKYNDELNYVYSKDESNQIDNDVDIDVAMQHIKNVSDELDNPISIFKYSLTTDERNGKKCYTLANENSIIYLDKETGLIVRVETIKGFETPSENEVQSTILDYSYEFNNVTDEIMMSMSS